jgi:hypothetical protein
MTLGNGRATGQTRSSNERRVKFRFRYRGDRSKTQDEAPARALLKIKGPASASPLSPRG